MKGIGSWFRKLSGRLRHAMTGRYAVMDKLNTVLLWCGFGAAVIGLFVPTGVRLWMTAISYGLMGWALFRFFSRSTYKRYRENRRLLVLIDRIRDREHKHFDCPRCRQPVRVPRGKGKIAITCPKCGERFVRKS